MKVIELYSGIGGMHYALKDTIENSEVILAVDINEVANAVYKHNFPDVNLRTRNIERLTVDEINQLKAETILLSPPCQPFTRVGKGKDIYDERSRSLLHLISLIPYLDSVKYLLLENVKGFEKSQARNQLIRALKSSNYSYKEFLLSPEQFNIENSRLRYYLVAKKKNVSADEKILPRITDSSCDLSTLPEEETEIETEIPEMLIGHRQRELEAIKNILEFNVWTESNPYALSPGLLEKYFSVLDFVGCDSVRTCCFTKAYGRYLQGTGSILTLATTDEIIKLKEGNHLLSRQTLIEMLKPRFFTPLEVARLMCFPSEFTFPPAISDRQKYKLLGNSVNVLVVKKMIRYLILAEF